LENTPGCNGLAPGGMMGDGGAQSAWIGASIG